MKMTRHALAATALLIAAFFTSTVQVQAETYPEGYPNERLFNVFPAGGGNHASYDFAGATGSSTPIEGISPRYFLWERTYNHTQNREDEVTAMAVAPNGNIWVTGFVQNLLTGYDYRTFVYDPNGNVLAEQGFGARGFGNDIPHDIAIDANSQAYITGQIWTSNDKENFRLTKYDQLGTELWSRIYNGTAADSDIPEVAVVDPVTGFVSVVGTSKTDSTNTLDYTVVTWDGNGVLQGVFTYHGDGSLADFPVSMAFDSTGNRVVTGHAFHGIQTEYDITTLKFDASDSLLWEARFSGLTNEGDYATEVAVDSEDNIIVSGHSRYEEDRRDYIVLKYDTEGNLLWHYLYDGFRFDDYATDMVLDQGDTIYVTGRSAGANGKFDIATVKIAPDGTERWAVRYDNFWSTDDRGIAMTLDDQNYVYVTGTTFDPTEDETDIITLCYDPAGNLDWLRQYSGSGEGEDRPVDILCNGNEGLYIGGTTYGGPDRDADYLLFKYEH